MILTRAIATLPSTEIARLLLEALEAAGDQLREGAIVAVGRENVRVRRLPIRRRERLLPRCQQGSHPVAPECDERTHSSTAWERRRPGWSGAQ